MNGEICLIQWWATGTAATDKDAKNREYTEVKEFTGEELKWENGMARLMFETPVRGRYIKLLNPVKNNYFSCLQMDFFEVPAPDPLPEPEPPVDSEPTPDPKPDPNPDPNPAPDPDQKPGTGQQGGAGDNQGKPEKPGNPGVSGGTLPQTGDASFVAPILASVATAITAVGVRIRRK